MDKHTVIYGQTYRNLWINSMEIRQHVKLFAHGMMIICARSNANKSDVCRETSTRVSFLLAVSICACVHEVELQQQHTLTRRYFTRQLFVQTVQTENKRIYRIFQPQPNHFLLCNLLRYGSAPEGNSS